MRIFTMFFTASDIDDYVIHSTFMPTEEAREAMEFKREQAKAMMRHSVLDGTHVYTKAAQTDVAATMARLMAEQKGKTRMKKVK